jgi:hypothetical protein
MTKKHFNSIADVLARNKVDPLVCREIATACAATNPNFDRRRFLIECGIDPRDI